MNVKLSTIELDASIQCRAAIDTETVNDYADRMTEGDKFPPVDLYGKADRCWIGDGWHRVMAAKQIGAVDIPAVLHKGARPEALKHALSANAIHGHRRTNADKRRCVEIALREFPKLSSRAVAELCGVSVDFVARLRQVSLNDTSPTVTGTDGKQYPATKGGLAGRPEWNDKEAEHKEEQPKDISQALEPVKSTVTPMDIANKATFILSSMGVREHGKKEALQFVIAWCRKEIRRIK